MKIASSIFAITLATPLLSLSTAALADFDFSPRVENGAIVIGGHDDENGIDVSTLHTGLYGFGDNALDPYNIGDPGFTTNGASTFKSGSSLYFTGQKIGGASLLYWDGTGTPTFTTAPTGVTLSLQDSPAISTTFSAAGETYLPGGTTSMYISSFASNGALHRHLSSSIFYNGAQDSGTVPEGAYLIAFTLSNPDGNAIANSATTYAVFNNGLDDETADAAVDYVNATYVPEPGVLTLTAGVGGLVLRRRRRHRA